MTKIVAFFEIFILLTFAVYSVFRVAKVITQKKPKEQEKKEEKEEQSLCDSCKYLVRKGGGLKLGKYKCEFLNGNYHESPVCCQIYERREEKKNPQEEEP